MITIFSFFSFFSLSSFLASLSSCAAVALHAKPIATIAQRTKFLTAFMGRVVVKHMPCRLVEQQGLKPVSY